MNTAANPARPTALRTVFAGLAVALACGCALAATTPPNAAASASATSSSAQARYERERARCLSGQSQEDTATCLKEAGAALQAARQHDLTDMDAAQLEANARKRCDAFKNDDDRRACIARVARGDVSGSVAGGGQLREYHQVIPGVQPSAAPSQPAGQ